MEQFIVAFDQGTTSSRAVLFDKSGKPLDMAQQEFQQHFPQPGWVEHDAEEIWATQERVFKKLLTRNHLSPIQVAAIGITNQRETTVVWNRHTGKPLGRAIVWQDRRTAPACERLIRDGHQPYIQQQTGLMPDSYFSATKLAWMLENIPNARKQAENGDLLFGTVDSWLLWNMTKGATHATDLTNASRTMLFNLHTLQWDSHLLSVFNIPKNMLPQVRPSSNLFGYYQTEGGRILIASIAGDQQAALFGQRCFRPGEAKNTYGTGCFMLMQTGTKPVFSQKGLITTIAWGIGQQVNYALEGSVFIAGAAIQWLRDGLHLIPDAPSSEAIARQARHGHGVYVVPAFSGMGTPYWDMYARGAIFGLELGTTQADLVRATLDSLAYQTRDLLEVMQQEATLPLTALKVDGGASANQLLMQFQADLLNAPVIRPASVESTATGAALLAGITLGWWTLDALQKELPSGTTTFAPSMKETQREQLYTGWKKAVARTLGWAKEQS